jgi:hypothetical protein
MPPASTGFAGPASEVCGAPDGGAAVQAANASAAKAKPA